jgi:hypothetical protein
MHMTDELVNRPWPVTDDARIGHRFTAPLAESITPSVTGIRQPVTVVRTGQGAIGHRSPAAVTGHVAA